MYVISSSPPKPKFKLRFVCSLRGTQKGSESIIARCSCSFFCILKAARIYRRRRRLGSLWCCKWHASLLLCSSHLPNARQLGNRYEKRKRRSDPSVETYHFIGYSSLYPFYCFPEKVRLRLSQFVIVPPFQHAGHGCT